MHILNKAKAHDVNIADSKVTPIGVMIHSKWGVEAEDNIFDNIKPL